MLNDIADGLARRFGGTTLSFIFSVVVEIFFLYTGEVVLYLITFGRKKPRWDAYTAEHMAKFWVLSDLSALIGTVFWIIAVGIIVWKWGY